MTTRLLLAASISLAGLTTAPCQTPRGPGPWGAGNGSCVGTTAGDVCLVNVNFGPFCVVSATGSLQCHIPTQLPPNTRTLPATKCFSFKDPKNNADYGICDVIFDSKNRCVVGIHSGQVQCN